MAQENLKASWLIMLVSGFGEKVGACGRFWTVVTGIDRRRVFSNNEQNGAFVFVVAEPVGIRIPIRW